MSDVATRKIAVLGAGSWGTALAMLLARNGHDTWLWGRNPERMSHMEETRENSFFLPGIPFPDKLHCSADLNSCLANVEDILVVVPSHAFRGVLHHIRPFVGPAVRVAWASKGLEQESQKLLHQIALEELGDTLIPTVVSGPTFAAEVAKGFPTAVTVASATQPFAEHFASLLQSDNFRPYTSNDIVGLEVGGAVKNVLAIAAGIADGLGFGANTRSALITRGLNEMMRLSDELGGHKETLMGLSGLGDLVLTCTDNQSRNRRMGLALGQGKTQAQAQAEIGQVVEGVQSAVEVFTLAKRLGIEMPIVEQVYQVLYQNVAAKDAVKHLLSRQTKAETV